MNFIPINDSEYPEIDVIFSLTGSFEPDSVTKALQIEPTKVWRSGEDIIVNGKATGRKYNSDNWSLATGLVHALDVEEQICNVLDIIKPHSVKVRELCDAYNIRSSIICAVYFNENNQPAIYLSSATIEKLVLLRSSIDFDLYPYMWPLFLHTRMVYGEERQQGQGPAECRLLPT